MKKILLPNISLECASFLTEEYRLYRFYINDVEPSYYTNEILKEPSFIEFRKNFISEDMQERYYTKRQFRLFEESNIFFGALAFMTHFIAETTMVYYFPISADNLSMEKYSWVSLERSMRENKDFWGDFSLLDELFRYSLNCNCNLIDATKRTETRLVDIVSNGRSRRSGYNKIPQKSMFLEFAELIPDVTYSFYNFD